jgi:S1-C subfamily serine protease
MSRKGIDMARRFTRWVILTGGLAALAAILALGVMPVAAAPAVPVSAGHAQASGERCVEVNGQVGLNVRSGPGVAYGVVQTLQPGAQLTADYARLQDADSYEWVPVRFSGGTGWVITPRLSPCAASPAATPAEASGATVLTAVNQDGTLDHNEIGAIARSVVLIANVQGKQIYATGTGTVTTPDGLIVTNAHVVEGAEQIAIGILDNINDPPEYRYLGKIVRIDKNIDVALIAIQSDLKGTPVRASNLHLPYIPVTLRADEVFRGDKVYIFGYPGIGDDYLVVTAGSIVSVENGDAFGQRVPVWYRTDAELAPGNSGGLAVNGNGEFVGIPTFVQTEQETGARLGGIRPAQVAMLAVSSEVQASPPQPGGEAVAVQIDRVTLDHGAVVGGEPGIRLHVAFTIRGAQDQAATVFAHFYRDDVGTTPLVNPAAPGQYRDKQNAVLTSASILPCCAETTYDDLPLFIPYAAFGIGQPGTYPLKIKVEVVSDDQAWRYTLSWEFITYSLR